MDEDIMVRVKNVSKVYRLGAIGGTTLREDLQRFGAKIKRKEDPTLKIGQTTENYGEKFKALDNVTFDVKKGEAVGIIGHNGAGKSTLLKLLSRVTAPSSGMLGLNGRVASMLEVGTGFHPELTGRENVYMNGAILGMTRAEIDSKMEEIIDFSEVRQFIDTPVKRYSSGMYVKLAFSVAAHLDSEIMIMDEVLAVGDMAFQQKCLGKMSNAANQEGRTILYVSHNMNTIRQLCTRCIVLDHGTVIFDGDVEDAINVYMGKQQLSPNYLEYTSVERSPEFKDGPAEIQSLNIVGDIRYSQYQIGVPIEGVLQVASSKDVDDAHLRIIVKALDGTPVTMATSDDALKLSKEDKNSIQFRLDTSNFTPGKYSLSFVLYRVNEFGTYANLDGLHVAYKFQIDGKIGFNNNMEWKHRYWGYMTCAYPLKVKSI